MLRCSVIECGSLSPPTATSFGTTILRHVSAQHHYSTGRIFPLAVEPNSELAPWGKRSRPRGRRCYTSEMQDEAAQEAPQDHGDAGDATLFGVGSPTTPNPTPV